MNVDYHVHPNLYGKSKKLRLRAMWKAFAAHGLDAVVCAEHVFKEPVEAYRMLAAAKPKHSTTHVFPGAELTTSEGVDVIAFAEHDWFDAHPALLEPYGMSLPEMVRYLESSELTYFIPHPTLLWSVLSKLYPTERDMQAFLASIPAFEAFNSSFLLLEHLCQYPLVKALLRPFRTRMRRSAQVDLTTYQRQSHAFLAIGSDAHHPWEIGFCVEIPQENSTDRSEVFSRITSNTNIQTLHFPQFDRTIVRLIAMFWTTLTEATMRRKCKMEAERSHFLEDSLELHTDIS